MDRSIQFPGVYVVETATSEIQSPYGYINEATQQDLVKNPVVSMDFADGGQPFVNVVKGFNDYALDGSPYSGAQVESISGGAVTSTNTQSVSGVGFASKIAITTLLQQGMGDNVTSISTSSITPSANKLILLVVQSVTGTAITPTPPTITGNNLTWTHVETVGNNFSSGTSYRGQVSLFRAIGASPTAGAITIDHGTSLRASWAVGVFEVSGADTGSSGANAIVQTATNYDASTNNLVITLPSQPAANSVAFTVFGAYNSAATAENTMANSYSPVGEIELADVGSQGSIICAMISNKQSHKANVYTPVTISGISVELKESATTSAIAVSDNFDDNSRDTSIWNAYNTFGGTSSVAETSGELRFTISGDTSYAEASTVNRYSLTDKHLFVKIADPPTPGGNTSREQIIRLQNAAGDAIRLLVSDQWLQADYTPNGSTKTNIGTAITYSSTTHAWLRIRETGGTTYFDTAPSTASNPPVETDYTNRFSVTNPFADTTFRVHLQAGSWDTETVSDVVAFDGFNTSTAAPGVTSTASSGQTQTVLGSASQSQSSTASTGQKQTISSSGELVINAVITSSQVQTMSGAIAQSNVSTATTGQNQSVAAAGLQTNTSTATTGQNQSVAAVASQNQSSTVATGQTQSVTATGPSIIASTATTGQNQSVAAAGLQTNTSTATTSQTQSVTATGPSIVTSTATTGQTQSVTVTGLQTNTSTATSSQTQTIVSEFALVIDASTTSSQVQTMSGSIAQSNVSTATTGQTQSVTADGPPNVASTATAGQTQSVVAVASQNQSSTVTTGQTQAVNALSTSIESIIATSQNQNTAASVEQRIDSTETSSQTQTTNSIASPELNATVSTSQNQTVVGNTDQQLSLAVNTYQAQTSISAVDQTIDGSITSEQVQTVEAAGPPNVTGVGNTYQSQSSSSTGSMEQNSTATTYQVQTGFGASVTEISSDGLTYQSQLSSIAAVIAIDGASESYQDYGQSVSGAADLSDAGTVDSGNTQNVDAIAELIINSFGTTSQYQEVEAANSVISSTAETGQNQSVSSVVTLAIFGSIKSRQSQTVVGEGFDLVPIYVNTLPGLVDRDASPIDNFHEYFTQYSINVKDLTIPSHIAVYSPDNSEDGTCIAILTPEPSLGAKKWTLNGKWITIGMYRDEGRQPGMKPLHEYFSWVRHDDQLVIYDTIKHQLVVGEKIKHGMTNVGALDSVVTKVINEYTFVCTTTPAGATHGSSIAIGSYFQSLKEVNFREEHVVFRMLPSFKLVPWSFVKEIFESSTPEFHLTRRSLHEIVSGADVKISNRITRDINYTVPYSQVYDTNPSLARRFNQLYDETGRPLTLKYDSIGQPRHVGYIDDKNQNNPAMLNNTIYTIDGSPMNPRVYVYDFYGLEINNPDRGPFNDIELVTRDEDVAGNVNNIKRRTDIFGTTLYTGKLYDEFGNAVVGIQENNALVTRQNILPLELDPFNHPVKKPNKRNSNGI